MNNAHPPSMLLATKLAVPQSNKTLVQRNRVLQKISPENGLRPLTIICAPAGFGKTTALVSALAAQSWPVAWLSLDEGDNDPSTLIEYVIAALQTVHPAFGQALLAQLKSPPARKAESLLPALINEIAALDAPLILALDDFHCLESEAVKALFESLLSYQPANLYIALTSRRQPPLSLSRLRAQGHLSELYEQDLRFTEDEVGHFFRHGMSLQVTDEELSVLQQRTEGWVAGLQLAALSLQDASTRGRFVQDFAGDDRFIADYLTEEVLRRQSDEIRLFLLQSAILSRMNGALCDALMQRSDSQSLLEQLERSDMFVIPLDNSRRWYRYHHLFGELLRSQLARCSELDEAELHRRAGHWFYAQGLSQEAMHHAQAGADGGLMMQILETHAEKMFAQGQHAQLILWFKHTPFALLQHHASLLMTYIWALYVGEGLIDDALVAHLEALVKQEGDEQYVGYDLHLMQGFQALQQRKADAALQYGLLAREGFAGLGHHQIAGLELQLGGAYFLADRVTEARQAFERCWQVCLEHDILLCISGAIGGVVSCLRRQGRIHEVEPRVAEALRMFDERGWHGMVHDSTWLYLGVADICMLEGKLDQVSAWLDQAAEGCEGDPWDTLIAKVDLRRMRLAYLQGDRQGLDARVMGFARYDIRPPLLPLFSPPDLDFADFCITLGNLEPAQHYLQQAGFALQDDTELAPITRGHFYEHLLLARLWSAQGRHAAANVIVDQLKAMALEDGRAGDVQEIDFLLDFAPYTSPVQNPVLHTLLSDKELKTLSLLAQGLSNHDIAARSYVSINTVKTHLKNIYAKLAVDSRLQAVEAARRFGLVA